MAGRTIQVRGLAEFDAKIKRFGEQMRTREVRQVVLLGAETLQQPVREESAFSSLTGAMSRAVVARLATRTDRAVAFMAVDVEKLNKRDRQGKPVRYPYIVEYGSDPHIIRSEHAMNLGSGHFARIVKHPGFAGRQFFARGVRRGRSAAKRAMEVALVDAAKRLGAE